MWRRVYPRTVVSVSLFYKNSTMCVDFIQSEPNHIITLKINLFSQWISRTIADLALNINQLYKWYKNKFLCWRWRSTVSPYYVSLLIRHLIAYGHTYVIIIRTFLSVGAVRDIIYLMAWITLQCYYIYTLKYCYLQELY